jgi:hypothetical protein
MVLGESDGELDGFGFWNFSDSLNPHFERDYESHYKKTPNS